MTHDEMPPLLNDGFNKITIRHLVGFVFEDVSEVMEPCFKIDNNGYYWHQSGYGCLSPDMVNVVNHTK